MWGYPQHQVHQQERPQDESFPKSTNYDSYGNYYQPAHNRIGLDSTPEMIKNHQLEERYKSYPTTGGEIGSFLNLNPDVRPPRWYVVPDSTRVHPTRVDGQYVADAAGLPTKYGHYDKPSPNDTVYQASFSSRLDSHPKIPDPEPLHSLPAPPPLNVEEPKQYERETVRALIHQPLHPSSPRRATENSRPTARDPSLANKMQESEAVYARLQQQMDHSKPSQPMGNPSGHDAFSRRPPLLEQSNLSHQLRESMLAHQVQHPHYLPPPPPMATAQESARDGASLPSDLPPLVFGQKVIHLPNIDSVELRMKDQSKILLNVKEFYRRHLSN